MVSTPRLMPVAKRLKRFGCSERTTIN